MRYKVVLRKSEEGYSVAFTLGGIVRDAGLTLEDFRTLP